ncbi:hypothetical protein PspLS_11776 [Pyricularia sp. CBS 133598]|nr:hypothetical protein PspLS_11776 [Pyricularia sp. CBS 133598]
MSPATSDGVPMATRALDASWGTRPWSFGKVFQLRDEVEDAGFCCTCDDAKDLRPAAITRIVEKIEMLEELAWILTTAEEDQLPEFFQDFNSVDNAPEWSLRQTGFLLCEAVQASKTRLFAAQNRPRLRISSAGAHDPVCQYCSWGFERLKQRKPKAKRAKGRDASPTPLIYRDKHAYARRFEDSQVTNGLHRVTEPEPLTERNVRFLRQRIASQENGKRHAQVPKFVPSRLIDLGDSLDACPRLLVGIAPADYPKFAGVENGYVTLSYCWGPPKVARTQLKMTSRNLKSFRAGIPLETMSPVMRDAVTVCRALKVRYLWIDALCIMQNHQGDWEVQSSKMCEVYSQSRFTICAASSSSCQEGFLAPTPDRSGPYLQIDCTYHAATGEVGKRAGASVDEPSSTGNLLALRFEPGGKAAMEFKNALDRDLALPDCAWSGRGWTYQEKTLAPRKLIFGRSAVHFIDDTMSVVTEGGRWHRITATYGYRGGTDPKVRANPITLLSDGGSHYRPLKWQQVVEQYTEMQLSFHHDVFPALSGVAALFVHHAPDSSEWGWEQDEYLAGLWKMDLHCTLLWYSRDPECLPASGLRELLGSLRSLTGRYDIDSAGAALGGKSAASSSFTAPTWSWASRKYAINFAISNGNGRPLCQQRFHMWPEYDLIRADVRVRGVNPFGRLDAASLRVAAKLLRLPPGSLTSAARLRDGTNELPVWKFWPEPQRPVYIITDWARSLPEHDDESDGVVDANCDYAAEDGLQLMLLSSCCTFYKSKKDTVPTGDDADKYITDPRGIWGIYRGMLYAYLRPGPPHCPYCHNLPDERDAWGLLVYPCEEDNTSYYRVGMWFSYARVGGGLSIFDSVEKQEITLL